LLLVCFLCRKSIKEHAHTRTHQASYDCRNIFSSSPFTLES
jgi:hypothetical protein